MALQQAHLQATLVTDENDSVNVVLSEFDEGKVGLVQVADRVEGELLEKGLMQVGLIPGMVACDFTNRGSQGCSALDVEILVSDILEVGFSWAETHHATCIGESPGSEALEKFNTDLAKSTDLAPVKPGTIRFGALSCTHNNMGLRAIEAGMPCADPMIAENGCFSLDRLAQRDKEYAKAVTNGLRWRVLDWKVRVLYPRVPELISLARNVGFDH